jgi:hypothetical protein
MHYAWGVVFAFGATKKKPVAVRRFGVTFSIHRMQFGEHSIPATVRTLVG